MTATDSYCPPIDAQLRYTVQWFHEWSEMQRGDFLPILAQKLAPGRYLNGLLARVDSLSCNEGRPPSLFQCRVKLFKEWFETWSQAERDQLLGHIKSMDPGFYTKIQEELASLAGKPANGHPAEEKDDIVEEEPSDPKENHHDVVKDLEETEATEATEEGASTQETVTDNGDADAS